MASAGSDDGSFGDASSGEYDSDEMGFVEEYGTRLRAAAPEQALRDVHAENVMENEEISGLSPSARAFALAPSDVTALTLNEADIEALLSLLARVDAATTSPPSGTTAADRVKSMTAEDLRNLIVIVRSSAAMVPVRKNEKSAAEEKKVENEKLLRSGGWSKGGDDDVDGAATSLATEETTLEYGKRQVDRCVAGAKTILAVRVQQRAASSGESEVTLLWRERMEWCEKVIVWLLVWLLEQKLNEA
ncbi:unnamed protein product [Zymoseptoria tritici ST99CH_1A5]|uniref:Uncharacterized protein n=1 Tax=Zymoseptoria tritici ST99CH_1A5 TaxID=1276529 RepID=A0A1Y6LL74_ZYMTR|nr:unnamed protein product [Zymoseptoria tritici ST99CH_1A5]